eukprot:CAMPEP_0174236056 /NCGR_PEP_ID=MMETSP0417-20130205/5306_1 /TAXON_ID=242541 /ORGANISM="Mayorella sp, Strain BSH-02190019" /LENGTH=192 /DNA_ID=CAMNT_0015314647 /DNA_START=63 /DNA_END=641 /DNA_ORIENTATION=-
MSASESSGLTYMVAVDASASSRNAVRAAVRMCQPSDQLVLFHVKQIQQPSLLDPFHDRIDRLLNQEAAEAAIRTQEECSLLMDRLNEARKASGQEQLGYRFVQCEGDARDSLLSACESEHVDVLLMGSRGLGTVASALMGSVSKYCVHNAPCAVLIVKNMEAHPEDAAAAQAVAAKRDAETKSEEQKRPRTE